MVSAGGECRDFNGVEFCCDETGHIFCDPNNPNVCGDPGYCQNLNNPELSCIPGEDWCCYSEGWVADYDNHRCCSPDYPFHYAPDDNCWTVRTPSSNNYYTNLAQCDYIWNPDSSSWDIDTECFGTEYKECVKNQISQWIAGWESKILLGKCGVECLDDSDCPKDSFIGNKSCLDTKIVQKFGDNYCNNYKCSYSESVKTLETCDYKCEDGECIGEVELNFFEKILKVFYKIGQWFKGIFK